MINQGICFKCHQYKKLEEHHIFGGPNRKNSQKYKLTVNLCAGCHREDADSAHRSAETAQWFHEYGQRLAMRRYGWTKEEFREVFHANYI